MIILIESMDYAACTCQIYKCMYAKQVTAEPHLIFVHRSVEHATYIWPYSPGCGDIDLCKNSLEAPD